MHEKWKKRKLQLYKRLARRTNRENIYRSYYDYLEKVLSPDFERADKEFKRLSFDDELTNDTSLLDNIWVMWWQGVNSAPPLVKKNIKSLIQLFGKDKVKVITKDNYEEYTSLSQGLKEKFDKNKISITNWSDVIRFNLLKNNGGIWVDATVHLSTRFFRYLLANNNKDFLSICNKENDYHYISNSKWSVWLMGGKKNYALFCYVNLFYDLYLTHHEIILDYYLVDDIIHHFYENNDEFRNNISRLLLSWNPYFWVNNFPQSYDQDYIDKFNKELKYSVQKLTYKYDEQLIKQKNFLTYLIKK